MFKTLKGKISLVYFCLVALIAFVGLASVINLYKLSKSIDGLMTNNYKSINAITNMLEAIERQDSAVLIYINGDRQIGINMFSENSSEFLKWYSVEYNNNTEPGEKEHVAIVNNYYLKYIKLFSELQEIRNSEGIMKSSGFYNSDILPDFLKLKKELKDLSLLNENAMFNRKEIATINAHRSINILLLLSAFAVIGGFLASRFFTNRFLKPIYALTQTTKLIKAGGLEQQSSFISQDESSQDEIGVLAHEFNNMTIRLQQFEQSTLGKLMTERNKSLAIIKSISDPLIVMDINYRIMLINKAFEKFFNVDEEKALSKHFLEIIRNGELFEHISSLEAIHEEIRERIFFIESMEEGYYFNVIVTLIRDADLKLSGYIVVFHNVTQLKELEKIRTDFIATISHEFKTPLTSIMMGTSLILDENMGKLNKKQKNVMETILEDGERLSKLVSDLLELSKIESEKSLFKIQPNSIKDIIETSIKPMYELAKQKGIYLSTEVGDNLPKVKADFERTTWVISNLITNALRYTNS